MKKYKSNVIINRLVAIKNAQPPTEITMNWILADAYQFMFENKLLNLEGITFIKGWIVRIEHQMNEDRKAG